jgi:hypothetical protein
MGLGGNMNVRPINRTERAFIRGIAALNKKVADGTFIWEATGVYLYDLYYDNLLGTLKIGRGFGHDKRSK